MVIVGLVGDISRAARTVGRTILCARWTQVLVMVVLLGRYLRPLLVLLLSRGRDTVTLCVQRRVVVG